METKAEEIAGLVNNKCEEIKQLLKDNEEEEDDRRRVKGIEKEVAQRI